jgi:hypothetical protein
VAREQAHATGVRISGHGEGVLTKGGGRRRCARWKEELRQDLGWVITGVGFRVEEDQGGGSLKLVVVVVWPEVDGRWSASVNYSRRKRRRGMEHSPAV